MVGNIATLQGVRSLFNPACFAAVNTSSPAFQVMTANNVWQSATGVTLGIAPEAQHEVVSKAIEASRTSQRPPISMLLFASSAPSQQIDIFYAATNPHNMQAALSNDGTVNEIPEDFDLLVEMLGDSRKCSDAAKALGELGHPCAVPPLINEWNKRFYRSDEFCKAVKDALVRLDKIAVAPLINELENKKSKFRHKTPEILGEIGDLRAVEPLIKALKDWDIDVDGDRSGYFLGNIAAALGKLGDPRALVPLIKAFEDNSYEVGHVSIAIALGELGDPRAINSLLEKLLDALENYDLDWEHRMCAAYSLGDLGDPRAVLPLIRALKTWRINEDDDPDGYFLEAIILSLGKLGDPRALDPLIEAFNDKYKRHDAAKALGELGDVRAVPALSKAVLDNILDNSATFDEVVEALVKLRDKRAVEPLIIELDRCCYEMTAYALGELGDVRAVPALSRALVRGEEEPAERALYKLGVSRDEGLIIAMGDPKEAVRNKAADAFVKYSTDAAGELIKVLENGPKDSRAQATYTLGKLLDDKRAKQSLINAMGDPDEAVRNKASNAFIEFSEDAVGELIKVLEKGPEDSRTQAAHTLGKLLNDQRAKQTLFNAMGDPDEGVRTNALEALVASLINTLSDPSSADHQGSELLLTLEHLFNDVTISDEKRIQIIDNAIQRSKEVATTTADVDDAMDALTTLLNSFKTELAYGIAKNLIIEFNPALYTHYSRIKKRLGCFSKTHRMKRDLQDRPLPIFGSKDDSRYPHNALIKLIQHFTEASHYSRWRVKKRERDWRKMPNISLREQYKSNMTAFCYPFAKLLPVHRVAYDAKSSQRVTDLISLIELSLSSDEWKTGEVPTKNQLMDALYDFGAGLPLPVIIPPINGHVVLANGHHRIAALVALVAHGILPPETLTRVPFIMHDIPRSDRTKAQLRKLFREEKADEQAFNFSWLDALSADPPSVEFLRANGYTQTYRDMLG